MPQPNQSATVPADSHSPPGRKASFLSNLGADLPASLVVFLVALPLSLGIAAASGAPIMAGLIAAAVGGIVAGSLGGSPLQVSGPAAGLTVVVAGLVDEFGWQVTCAITAAAGVVQLLMGVSRIGRAALAVSPVVVKAMLAGIGITIILQQLHVLLGGQAAGSAIDNLTGLPAAITNVELHSALLGLAVVAILLTWKFLPAPVRKIPGPLAAVVVVTAVSVAVAPSVERISFSGSIFDAIALPSLPDGNWRAAAMAVITVALIASIESLLSAVAVDKMGGSRTNLNRELVGQGSANVVSGMLGGLPVTGVIVRSATNVEAGAKSRNSAILHGVWVLVFSALFAGLIQLIPLAVLAGLLLVIGAKLVKVADIRTSLRTGDLLVYSVTLVCVVALNLLEGVIIGLALAALCVLWRVLRAQIHAHSPSAETLPWRVTIAGSCSFFALPRLNRVLHSVPEGQDVVVELNADYLDHAFREALIAWHKQQRNTGATVTLEEHGTTAFSDAEDNAPQRQDPREFPLPPRTSWLPSGAVTPADDDGGRLPLRSILLGIDKYHRRHADKVRPLVQDLTEGQNPDTLFVACVDSRVNPNLITSSGPGDLLTLRNIGNVVCSDSSDASIDSALSFAVKGLSVDSVVVCGHSNCGAMKAVIADAEGTSPDMGAGFDTWLGHARPSYSALLSEHPVAVAAAAEGYSRLDQLSMVNVALQLRKLEQHPVTGPALASGQVQATGLFYDICTARVVLVTPEGIEQLDPSMAVRS
ncbi:SulP family inorganic anion transporter [Paenarthrobacter aurescens]|uniref:Putative transmembrane carbonic anhydrase n=1 Tax=Paenarthrobacter aurescens TaxID=43663 RepID=A0A4Y3NAV5_PAEAU|nr:bifunctional SulP family inorganic anion transporter/carbonic anhydrase [Paenarthrobacter aurescens]MDO6144814.1 bifunctional SulP family inorganic anion transporter/carbonic anhydrase [Paenarthrobacter aurescens]MDO6148659.1 bifunctional SulP family inorganic anion transporter/carbonic anhydrase [Paenarthrobacter aurescens]MDO6159905.1 bifunctional SulP family inorganic anion transporter/carbonic anhydrase [Paenarthrobacter aurescens]MDO6163764.1 bifunctional SulP family inorganic anion tra